MSSKISRRTFQAGVSAGAATSAVSSFAIDSFYEWPEARRMMGGLFDGHPWTRNGTWSIAIESPQHPLTTAFHGENFSVTEEVYRVSDFSREKSTVLLSLDLNDEATLNALFTKHSNRAIKTRKEKGLSITAIPETKPADNPPVVWAHNYGYHVISRGIDRHKVFHEDADRIHFSDRLAEAQRRFCRRS